MECHSPCCAEPSIRAGYRLDLFKERLAAASLKGGKPLLLQVVGSKVLLKQGHDKAQIYYEAATLTQP